MICFYLLRQALIEFRLLITFFTCFVAVQVNRLIDIYSSFFSMNVTRQNRSILNNKFGFHCTQQRHTNISLVKAVLRKKVLPYLLTKEVLLYEQFSHSKVYGRTFFRVPKSSLSPTSLSNGFPDQKALRLLP